MAAYDGPLVEHEFYDADKPQHPMALPPGQPFEVVRTEAADQGYGQVLGVNGVKDARAVTFRHYVRKR